MNQIKPNIAATAHPVTLNPAIGHPRQQRPVESAAGIATQQLAFQRMVFPPDAIERAADPKNLVESTPYAATCTRPWSRSSRDCHHAVVGGRGCRLMIHLSP
jgi:hypothetical protein